jgi:NAD(P)-dependent dehydrogenase (short-subunit alcohol dehydrogenase family)
VGERLAGRVALVTGAGNGIGKAIALLLAREGARVVANDRGTDMLGEGNSTSAADGTVAEIESLGGQAVASYDSVAEYEGAGRAVQRALDAFGRIDISVNCAGAAIEGSIFDMPVETYERSIALQMSQKWYLARHAVPLMVSQGWGRVVNTTSHGALGDLGQPAFAAAMGGVISMTKAIATETKGTGVTANCLAPNAATRLHAKSHDDFRAWHEQGIIDDDMWDSYLNAPPPDYVAPAVVWLCTDAAAHVTGQVMGAGGGTVTAWSGYGDRTLLYRGDHRANAPWTLDELDQVAPRHLFPRTVA